MRGGASAKRGAAAPAKGTAPARSGASALGKIYFADVEKHIKDIENDVQTAIDHFKGLIKKAKDREGLPVYLVKSRLKSADSAYLKTKRDSVGDLREITDYGGIRLLCLFERDLFEVNRFMLDLISNLSCELKKYTTYNFSDSGFRVLKKLALEKKQQIKRDKRPSGYKSIHYVLGERKVGKETVFIEIQLRTLIQDVWGELEHSLSYKKGGIHPTIKKSFELLARDLENVDKLMEHLRDIKTKEKSWDYFTTKDGGPKQYFDYETALVPQPFKARLAKEYEEYLREVKGLKLRDKRHPDFAGKLDKAKKRFYALRDKLNGTEMKTREVEYWDDMEAAFYAYLDGDYEKARGIYEKLLKEHGGRYCLHYRLGEQYLKLGETEKALKEFDECERLFSGEERPDFKNGYLITLMLAYVYWMLGDDYMKVAIEQVDKAERIYKANKALHSRGALETLLNNLSYYYLEKYLHSLKAGDYELACGKFKDLESFMKTETAGEPLSSNTMDTAAWFYYHRYLRRRNPKDAEQAKKYCERMREGIIKNVVNFTSIAVQINHIKEIMGLEAAG